MSDLFDLFFSRGVLRKKKKITIKEMKKEIRESNKIFGFDIIISDDPNDESYQAGFKAGAEFVKEKLLKKLLEYKD